MADAGAVGGKIHGDLFVSPTAQAAPTGSDHGARGGGDPALAPFLRMLDDHISAHPEQLQPITTGLMARLDDLVGAVDVDLNAPLAEEDEVPKTL